MAPTTQRNARRSTLAPENTPTLVTPSTIMLMGQTIWL
jgi:hypothetical protein